jgi:hypothetical protein
MRVFENRVLSNVFGPKMDEVTGEWRELHSDDLNDLCCSLNVIRVIKSRRMKWAGHVARIGERKDVYRVLVGKPEGKRPLGRSKHRWEDNIKNEMGELDWIDLAQDRNSWRAITNTVMNFRVP